MDEETSRRNIEVMASDRRRDSSGYLIAIISEMRVEVSRAVSQVMTLRDEYLDHKRMEEEILKKVMKDLDVHPDGHIIAHREESIKSARAERKINIAIGLSAAALALIVATILNRL